MVGQMGGQMGLKLKVKVKVVVCSKCKFWAENGSVNESKSVVILKVKVGKMTSKIGLGLKVKVSLKFEIEIKRILSYNF